MSCSQLLLLKVLFFAELLVLSTAKRHRNKQSLLPSFCLALVRSLECLLEVLEICHELFLLSWSRLVNSCLTSLGLLRNRPVRIAGWSSIFLSISGLQSKWLRSTNVNNFWMHDILVQQVMCVAQAVVSIVHSNPFSLMNYLQLWEKIWVLAICKIYSDNNKRERWIDLSFHCKILSIIPVAVQMDRLYQINWLVPS